MRPSYGSGPAVHYCECALLSIRFQSHVDYPGLMRHGPSNPYGVRPANEYSAPVVWSRFHIGTAESVWAVFCTDSRSSKEDGGISIMQIARSFVTANFSEMCTIHTMALVTAGTRFELSRTAAA